MSLDVSISSRAEQDMTLQHRWYLETGPIFSPAQQFA